MSRSLHKPVAARFAVASLAALMAISGSAATQAADAHTHARVGQEIPVPKNPNTPHFTAASVHAAPLPNATPVAGNDIVGYGSGSATADPFTLSSRPHSTKTIYLNFQGNVLTNSNWNSYLSQPTLTYLPYSQDSDTTTFNADEAATIRSAWQQVAEDFAPFDVNVTTMRPDPSALSRSSDTDATYGSEALITNTPYTDYEACPCGGLTSSVDFSSVGTHTPVLVFAQAMYNIPGYIAMVSSHELGHALGLNHDGIDSSQYYETRNGPWGPLMGAPYGVALSQWSIGDYAGATNTQDDVAVIGAQTGFAPDDAADTPEQATALPLYKLTLGLINSQKDRDVFSFNAYGMTVVNLAPLLRDGTNLETGLIILGPDKTTVVDNLTASLSGPNGGTYMTDMNRMYMGILAPGTYYAMVDGVGDMTEPYTAHSDYGSMGRYTINFTTGAAPKATVTKATLRKGQSSTTKVVTAGGAGSFRYTVSKGKLPAGLTLNATTGRITGKATKAGVTTVTVTMTDMYNFKATSTVTLTVK
jgi:Putative Ig domain